MFVMVLVRVVAVGATASNIPPRGIRFKGWGGFRAPPEGIGSMGRMSTPTNPGGNFGARTPQRRPSFYESHLREMLVDSGYAIHERIGSGGMGIVYRATDAAGLDVALKVLRPEIAGDERARARLSREMRALQRVNHPNVSRVLDAEFDLDVAFLVTEYISGPTFQKVIDDWGHLPLRCVREIGLPLGKALLDVHEKGIVHRDLKPSNIMLRTGNGSHFDFDIDPVDPVIIDFGIAQAAEESRMTSTGLMMGTISYLAPEVISNNIVDAAADWWAWAAMLAHAATGFPPFGKGRLGTVYNLATMAGPDLEGLPEPCIEWFKGAFAPEPGDRTPPEKLIEALEHDVDAWVYGNYDPTSSSPSSPSTPTELPTSRIETGERGPLDGPIGAGTAGSGAAAPSGAAARAAEATAPIPPYSPLSLGGGEEESTGAMHDATDELDDTDEWDVSNEEPTQVMPVLDETPTARFAPISTPAAPPVAPHAGAMPAWQPSEPTPQAPMPAAGPQGPFPAAQYPPTPGAQPYAMPLQPLPYHLREPKRRTTLVLLGMALFTAFGALVPLAALILLVLMTALARTWQRSWIAQEKGQDRGKGSGGITASIALLAVPRFLGALLEALLQALIPMIVTAGILLATDALLVWLARFEVHYAVYAGVLVGVTTLSLWWGIGSRTTRYGSHRLLHAAAPSGLWTAIFAAVLLVLIAAVCFTIASRGGHIDYFPYVGEFRLEDISPWRK